MGGLGLERSGRKQPQNTLNEQPIALENANEGAMV
jgi:hypothetical protein